MEITIPIKEKQKDKLRLMLTQSIGSGEIDGVDVDIYAALNGMVYFVKFGEKEYEVDMNNVMEQIYEKIYKKSLASDKHA